MKNLRHLIEHLFEVWSVQVVKHRWWILAMTLAFSAAVIPQLRNGWVDVSIESFLPAENPALQDYNDFRLLFTYAPGAVLTVELEDSVFTMENLNRVRAMHEYIEQNTPYLLKITSLANVRYTRDEDDVMVTGDLSEIWPQREEDIPAFRDIVMSNDNYLGGVISRNEHILNVLIDPLVFDPDNRHPNQQGFTYLQAEEEGAFSKTVHEMADKLTQPGFKVRNAGGPTMNYSIAKDMEASTGRSVMLGMAIIVVLLALLFRRVSGVLLPLLVVVMTLLVTMALWPLLGYPYNGNTQIIPSFLLAVGIADAVHILSIFYRHYDNGMEKFQAITQSMRETAIAVLLTTITTAVGLLSFLASDMMPTMTMGLFGAIGVMMALFYTLALLPALLAILPIRRHSVQAGQPGEEGEEKTGLILRGVDATVDAFARLGVEHAKTVGIATLAISLVAIAGLVQVRLEHDPLSWYPDDNPLRKGIALVDEHMDGSMFASIILKTHQQNTLHDPQFLNVMQDIETHLKNLTYADIKTNNAISLLSIVKETHRALNGNDPAFFSIPQDRELVAQELLLFESGSDDMYDFTDHDLSLARIDIRLQWGNVLYYRDYVKLIQQEIETVLKAHNMPQVEVKVVGLLAIFGETLYNLLIDTIESYLMAFLVVFLIMWMMMESFRGGLIAIIPNLFPILFTVGMIGWLDIPLNIITSTIGCIIIGISVDDTIHFMHHFRRYMQQSHNVKDAIYQTLHTCGRAIFFTSVVLIGGFIVHLTGELSTNKEFGWMLSIAIFMALLANLILAPALLMLFWKNKPGSTQQAD